MRSEIEASKTDAARMKTEQDNFEKNVLKPFIEAHKSGIAKPDIPEANLLLTASKYRGKNQERAAKRIDAYLA